MSTTRSGTAALDRRGLVWGAIGVAIVIALTVIGSDRPVRVRLTNAGPEPR